MLAAFLMFEIICQYKFCTDKNVEKIVFHKKQPVDPEWAYFANKNLERSKNFYSDSILIYESTQEPGTLGLGF